MDYMDPMSSVLKKADKLNLSLSLSFFLIMLHFLNAGEMYKWKEAHDNREKNWQRNTTQRNSKLSFIFECLHR